MTLMFAYGSNMNPDQIKERAPGARSLGSFKLANWRLVFRMVADIESAPGEEVQGILYELTPEDEARMDVFEGVEAGTYSKEYFTVMTPEGEREVLTYLMNSDGIFPPTEAYYARIVAGYRAAGLKFKPLREAKDRAWDDRNPSHKERQRYARAGRPRLAQRSNIVDESPVPVEIDLGQDPRVSGMLTDEAKRMVARKLAKEKPAGGKKRKVKPIADEFPADAQEELEERIARHRERQASRPRQNLLDWLDDRRHSGRGY